MTDKVFVDSNIWLYLFLKEDENKFKRAEKFIYEKGNKNILIISFQVINEVTNVLRRKGFLESDIRAVIEQLSRICIVQNYSKDIVISASHLREENNFSFWDSHVVASAIVSGCCLLASEDMQDGQTINRTTIINVFKSE